MPRWAVLRFSSLCVVSILLVATACSERPKAPPLSNESVFQNDRVGIRFLAPEGWAMTSRGELPPGNLARPTLIVSYLQTAGEKPATFELLAVDLPEDANLAEYLA